VFIPCDENHLGPGDSECRPVLFPLRTRMPSLPRPRQYFRSSLLTSAALLSGVALMVPTAASAATQPPAPAFADATPTGLPTTATSRLAPGERPSTPKPTEQSGEVTNYPFITFEPVDGASLHCTVDGGEDQFCDDDTLVGLAEGPHTVSYTWVNDDNTDLVSDPYVYEVTVDRTAPPTPTVLSQPPAETTDTTATLTYTVEDGADGVCAVDSGEFQQCDSPLVLRDLSVGQHTVRLQQSDRAGNTSPGTEITWTVLAKAPAAAPGPQPGGQAPPTVVPPLQDLKLPLSASSVKVTEGGQLLVRCDTAGATPYACRVTVKVDGKTSGTATRVGNGDLKVTLSPAAARAAKRLGGVKLTIQVDATATDGTKRSTTQTVRVLPASTVKAKLDGFFTKNRSKATSTEKRQAKALVGKLAGAKSVVITAHTDKGDTAAQAKQRAQRFLKLLRQQGLKSSTRVTIKTAGAAKPSHSSSTAKGRELNRRIEVAVRY
jgi:outer membrane protein OmpA-like peptidoglycan-associated protein